MKLEFSYLSILNRAFAKGLDGADRETDRRGHENIMTTTFDDVSWSAI